MDRRRKSIVVCVVAGVLAISAGLMIVPARHESQTSDEATYLVSGLSYWRTGDFRLNVEHPPLVKEFLSLPLLAQHATFFANDSDWNGASQWDVAPKVLYGNTVSGPTLLASSRYANIGLTLLLIVLCTWWSYRAWGMRGAAVTLALAAFEPNILANGHLATTDVGYTLGVLACMFTFGWWIERPTARRTAVLSVAFAGALLTRFNAAILIVVLPLQYLVVRVTNGSAPRVTKRQAWSAIVSMAVVAFFCIWATYGFELRVLDRVQDATARHEIATLGSWGSFMLHTPLPAASYLSGMLWQLGHNAGGQVAYLFGQVQNGGWWYYFPVALIIKMTIVSLVFAAVALILSLRRRSGTSDSLFGGWFIGVPFIILLGIAMAGRLDIGVRYVLPVICLLVISAGGIVRILTPHSRWLVALLVLCLGLNVLSVVRNAPHYLPYANEAFGGPSNLHRLLADSNIDWGQDVPLLTAYLSDHGITNASTHPFSNVPRTALGLSTTDVPQSISEPWYGVAALGVSELAYGNYSWLQGVTPTAVLGHSINVYDFRQTPAQPVP